MYLEQGQNYEFAIEGVDDAGLRPDMTSLPALTPFLSQASYAQLVSPGTLEGLSPGTATLTLEYDGHRIVAPIVVQESGAWDIISENDVSPDHWKAYP